MGASPLLARLGLRTGGAGTAATLAIAIGTSLSDAARIGVFSDTTAAAEKLTVVVGGVTGPSFNRSGTTVLFNPGLTASQWVKTDASGNLTSVASVPGSAVGLTANFVGFGDTGGTLTGNTNFQYFPDLATGGIILYNNQESANTYSGCMAIAGGLGIGKRLNVAGAIKTFSTAASTSSTTGSLIADGGAGIAGALHVGGVLVPRGGTPAASGNTIIGSGVAVPVTETVIVGDLAGAAAGTASRDVFVGYNARAAGDTDDAVAIGYNSSVGSGANGATAIGSGTSASAASALALGAGASSTAAYGVSIGSGSGTGARATGADSVAIGGNNAGNGAAATAAGAIAIGPASTAQSGDSIAIGRSANTTGGGEPIAIGYLVAATANYSIAMGRQTTASASNSLALGGLGAAATAVAAVAIGSRAASGAPGAIAIGAGTGANLGAVVTTNASYVGAIAIGGGNGTDRGALASNDGCVAIGGANNEPEVGASASGRNAIAIGSLTTSSARAGVAIGWGSSATNGNYSIAIGNIASANSNAGDGAIAIGRAATVAHADSVAIGRNAASTKANQMVLGAAATLTEVYIPATTAATSSTSGTLVVGGGAGFGGDIYAAGVCNIGLSSTISVANSNAANGVTGAFYRTDGQNGSVATLYGRSERTANGGANIGVHGHARATGGDGTVVGVDGLAQITNVGGAGACAAYGGRFSAASAVATAGKYAYGITASATATGGSNAATVYGGSFTATGAASSATAYGVYATASGAVTNWAGYFAGNVNITGTLSVTGKINGDNLKYGTGTPEAAVTGVIGDVFQRTDGGTGTTLYIKESGSGNTGWVPVAASSGTPGGSTTEIQYNDGGVFGGNAYFTYNKTTNELTLNTFVTTPVSTVTTAGASTNLSAATTADDLRAINAQVMVNNAGAAVSTEIVAGKFGATVSAGTCPIAYGIYAEASGATANYAAYLNGPVFAAGVELASSPSRPESTHIWHDTAYIQMELPLNIDLTDQAGGVIQAKNTYSSSAGVSFTIVGELDPGAVASALPVGGVLGRVAGNGAGSSSVLCGVFGEAYIAGGAHTTLRGVVGSVSLGGGSSTDIIGVKATAVNTATCGTAYGIHAEASGAPVNWAGYFVGNIGTTGVVTFVGATSGSASIGVAAVAGTPATLILPTTDGSSGDVLSTDGAGNLSWFTSPTIPTIGGSAGEVLISDGLGNADAYSGLTWSSTNGTLAVDQDVTQAANGFAALALTSTWNSAGTTFYGMVYDVTNTASAAGSLLFDLRVGGVSKFAVDKTGVCTLTALLQTAASGTAAAGLNLPHGSAPTSPVDGDVWTTTAGMYARINGTTVGPFGAGGGAPAGSDTYVQYNTSGAFDADASFTFDADTYQLKVAASFGDTSDPSTPVEFVHVNPVVSSSTDTNVSGVYSYLDLSACYYLLDQGGGVWKKGAAINAELAGTTGENSTAAAELVLYKGTMSGQFTNASGGLTNYGIAGIILDVANVSCSTGLYKAVFHGRMAPNAQDHYLHMYDTGGSATRFSVDGYGRIAVLTPSIGADATAIVGLNATWNAGSTTFAGIELDVTDTASAAASLLANLKVGGNSVFNVTKKGQTYVTASQATAYSEKALSVTTTFDNASVAFDALYVGVTDTASNAAARLINAEVGGNARFTVNKGGKVWAYDGVDVYASATYKVNGVAVLGAQGAAVADATGAGDVVAQLNALLARCRTHGLIAT